MTRAPLFVACLAEGLGTFLLVFFGCGSVHSAVLTGSLVGAWQVGSVWAVAISGAIIVTAPISDAHINPAITFGMATWGRFPWNRVAPYVVSQTAGAFVAAAALYVIFLPYYADKELQKKVARGQPGSEITAMCFAEYFPNPGSMGEGKEPYSAAAHAELNKLVSEPAACFVEFLGTAILALVVAGITEPRNPHAPKGLAPWMIGLTVAALISVLAPLTQACFNPARDFGPRLFAALAGWGSIALPGPRGMGFLTVYILAPIVGGIAGVGLYDFLIKPYLPASSSTQEAKG